MTSGDYASAVRGGLKLKGAAKPAGIKKKKKKDRSKDTEAESESKKSALQRALEEEDAGTSKEMVRGGKGEGEDMSEDQLRELEEKGGDGKTAAERAYEEMRRRRVCSPIYSFSFSTYLCRALVYPSHFPLNIADRS